MIRPVKFHLGLPTDHVDMGDEFVSVDAISAISAAADAAGFESVFVTEHPFPPDEWMSSGGHHALDPFVALSFAAAATSRIKLLTYLCVLPYRNPFLAAKAALTLDVLSGGRLVLGVGAGYLEAEFRAVGVAFDERNELLDESIDAMRRAWTQDSVTMTGRHFDAQGHTMMPRPAQPGGPPIWVGGNSRRALRRAAQLGNGWLPMYNPRALGARRHSAHLENLDDLRSMLTYLRECRDAAGATDPFDVIGLPMVPTSPDSPEFDRARVDDHFAELESLGVTGLTIFMPTTSRAAYLDGITRFADEYVPA
jgi:probable F420-dependent oxidoreductase